jgi:hypothetical protein
MHLPSEPTDSVAGAAAAAVAPKMHKQTAAEKITTALIPASFPFSFLAERPRS